MEEGAKRLNWKVDEIPRWFKYENKHSSEGRRMTMSRTYLKGFLENHGNVVERTEVKKNK